MSINISGISASYITQALLNSQSEFTKIAQSLASGVSSETMPADEYISQMINGNTQSCYAAISNAQSGINFTDLADATLSSVSEDVQRIRELAVQAANGTYTADQKAAIQAEIDQIADGIKKTMATTNYNGKNVLNLIQGDDSQEAELVKFQVGITSSSESEIAFDPNIELPEINFDVTTNEGAKNAIDKADEMLNAITSKRVDIATTQTALLSSVEQNQTAITNNQSSVSQIQDTDYAAVISDLIKNQYSQEALIKVLQASFTSQASALSLLSGL